MMKREQSLEKRIRYKWQTLQHKQWVQTNLLVVHSQNEIIDVFKMLLFNFDKITFY